MSILFRAMYRLGFTPWDSGVSPPELKDLIEGPQARPPGKALDLGCGTGTNSIYLAQHGWDVTGIDFIPRAVERAKAKAAAAKVTPRLIQGDVTRLAELNVGGGFSLVFDLGCYHSIPESKRDGYARGMTTATVPGATWLVWGFNPKLTRNPLLFAKMTRDELDHRFGKDWSVVRDWGGETPGRFPGGWYQLERK